LYLGGFYEPPRHMPQDAKAGTVLLVEPDSAVATSLTQVLAKRGLSVSRAVTGAQAIELLEKEPARVVLSELTLPDTMGTDLLKALERLWPGLPVVMMSANASVSDAMAALRAGASDFMQKPIDPEEMMFALNKALTVVERRAEQPPPPSSHERAGIIGDSPTMRQVYATLERAAQGTATVLVRGESGTGKELAARAIHDASPRAAGPFVKIDCTSLPEHLLESELFGYEKGAFTGAVARKPGRAELADKGTLFLDEIGELSLSLQAKLLRLLQDRQIERLGGTKTIAVDVRVVAATHRDLESMVERQQFRLDLFYRLNVVPLWLPPLRARREDIDVLVEHFCKLLGRANGKPSIGIERDAIKALRGQRWPGNVRQLQNFVERLVVLSSGPSITEADVRCELSRQVRFATQPGTALRAPTALAPAPPPPAAEDIAPPSDPTSVDERPPVMPTEAQPVLPLDMEVRAAEKKALERALTVAKHNRSLAARLLGVSRSTLYAKLEEHGLL
jgi:two-component system, NtrC family, response regulator AtoC